MSTDSKSSSNPDTSLSSADRGPRISRENARETIHTAFDVIVGALEASSATCYDDQHLRDTAGRLTRALMDDYFWGLWQDPTAVLEAGRGVFRSESNQMITLSAVPIVSFCAHHWLPFLGNAYVAYIPNKKLVGLSKIPRMIDVLCHRPQVQERLTEQIADCLYGALEAKGVAVMLEAEHLCMSIRGVMKQGARTRTTALRGILMTDDAARAEFLAGVNGDRR